MMPVSRETELLCPEGGDSIGDFLLEASMRFIHRLGIRGMLADFSSILGTLDGEY